jgi:hypothetical protein
MRDGEGKEKGDEEPTSITTDGRSKVSVYRRGETIVVKLRLGEGPGRKINCGGHAPRRQNSDKFVKVGIVLRKGQLGGAQGERKDSVEEAECGE